MAEGRPIHGDGIDNLQDYVEERLTYGTDSDEFAAANRTLEQAQADLATLQQEHGRSDARPDVDALINEAQLEVDRMQQPSQQVLGGAVQSDSDRLPPEAEARSAVTKRMSNEQA